MDFHKLSVTRRLGLAVAGQGALLLGVLMLDGTYRGAPLALMAAAALASAALVWWAAHGVRAALARTVALAAPAVGAKAALDDAAAVLRRAIDRAGMTPATGRDPQPPRGRIQVGQYFPGDHHETE